MHTDADRRGALYNSCFWLGLITEAVSTATGTLGSDGVNPTHGNRSPLFVRENGTKKLERTPTGDELKMNSHEADPENPLRQSDRLRL